MRRCHLVHELVQIKIFLSSVTKVLRRAVNVPLAWFGVVMFVSIRQTVDVMWSTEDELGIIP